MGADHRGQIRGPRLAGVMLETNAMYTGSTLRQRRTNFAQHSI